MNFLSGGDARHILSLGLRLVVLTAVLLLGLTPVPGTLIDAIRRGRIASAAGDYERAADAYQHAYDYAPWQAGSLAAVVEAELQAGDYDRAEQDLTRLAALKPLQPGEMLWWGTIYAGQGSEARAAEAWEQAWTAGAISTDGLTQLADGYLAVENWAEAQRALEELDRLGGSSADQLVRLAALQAFDAPQAARGTLDRAAALDDADAEQIDLMREVVAEPDDPAELRLTRLGVALLQTGDVSLAEAALDRAVLINPAYGEALAYLAYARALRDEPALGAAQQAVAVSPENAAVHLLAGLVWEAEARPVEARQALSRAYELEPTPATAVEIAATHRMQNQPAQAEAWMQEAVRLSEDDFTFRLLLGQFYVDANYRVEEVGMPLLSELAEEQPDNAEVHAALGWGYFLLGDPNAAFVEIDYALGLNPDSPRANAHKGALLDSQGRIDEAVMYYERAVELAPRGTFGVFARRALERIEG